MVCGKIVYETRREATKALAQYCDKNGSKNRPTISYYCEVCSGWHVASKRKRKTFKVIETEEIHSLEKEKRNLTINDKHLKIKNFSSNPL